MSGRPNEGEGAIELVLALAEIFNLPLRREHVEETATAWRLMQPHLQRLRAVELAPEDEAATFFRP